MTLKVRCPLCLEETPIDRGASRAGRDFRCERCGVVVPLGEVARSAATPFEPQGWALAYLSPP